MTDLKKPQEEPYPREDYLDSGMKPGQRGAPISIGEATRAIELYFHDYEGLIGNFLLRRVKRLEKEVRDLKATLEESASNGGTWPV